MLSLRLAGRERRDWASRLRPERPWRPAGQGIKWCSEIPPWSPSTSLAKRGVRFQQEMSSVDKLPPSSGSGDGNRDHRNVDLRSGAWLRLARGAGRRLGRQGQRTRMGWQRWRTKSGHPTRLTAFLSLPSPQRSQSPRSVGGRQHGCSLPAVALERDAIEDTRGVHSGWGARGAASPRTHRPLGHLLWGRG